MAINHSNHTVTATVTTTGELIEYTFATPQDLAEAYKDNQAHLEARRQIKSTMLDLSMHLITRQVNQDKKGTDT